MLYYLQLERLFRLNKGKFIPQHLERYHILMKFSALTLILLAISNSSMAAQLFCVPNGPGTTLPSLIEAEIRNEERIILTMPGGPHGEYLATGKLEDNFGMKALDKETSERINLDISLVKQNDKYFLMIMRLNSMSPPEIIPCEKYE